MQHVGPEAKDLDQGRQLTPASELADDEIASWSVGNALRQWVLVDATGRRSLPVGQIPIIVIDGNRSTAASFRQETASHSGLFLLRTYNSIRSLYQGGRWHGIGAGIVGSGFRDGTGGLATLLSLRLLPGATLLLWQDKDTAPGPLAAAFGEDAAWFKERELSRVATHADWFLHLGRPTLTAPDRLGPFGKLTATELYVLEMLSRHWPYSRIARALGCAEKTARLHGYHVFSKLGVHSATEAVGVSRDVGILAAKALF